MKVHHQSKTVIILGVAVIGIAVIVEIMAKHSAKATANSSTTTATTATTDTTGATDTTATATTSTSSASDTASASTTAVASNSTGTASSASSNTPNTSAETSFFPFALPTFPGFGLGLFSPSASTSTTASGAAKS